MSSILRGIPGTGGVKDPATRRVLDAVVDNLRRMAPQPVQSGTPTSAIPAVTRTVVTRETQTVGEFKLLNTGGGVPLGSRPQPDTLQLRTLTVGELVEIVAQAGGTIQIGLGTPPSKPVTEEDLPLMYRPSTGEYFIEGEPDPEPENLLLAIKERQIAWGITTAWDSGDPANPAKLIDDSEATEYTIGELRAYVNYIAQGNKYIDPTANAWNGGTTLPATLNNATWVDGTNAADEAALMVKVKSLLYTVYSLPSETFTNPKQAYGAAGNTEPLSARFAEAHAAALNNIQAGNTYTFAGAYMKLSANKMETPSIVQCTMEWKAWKYSLSGLSAALSKSVRVFNKFSVFTGHGPYNAAFVPDAGAEDAYVRVTTTLLGAATSGETAAVGGSGAPSFSDIPPPDFPTMPEGSTINDAFGCCWLNGKFAMVEWAFTAR